MSKRTNHRRFECRRKEMSVDLSKQVNDILRVILCLDESLPEINDEKTYIVKESLKYLCLWLTISNEYRIILIFKIH